MSHQSTEMADVRDISSRMTTVAIEGGRTEVAATSNDITSWALKTEGMFGFDAHHELNVKQSIIKAEKAKGLSRQ